MSIDYMFFTPNNWSTASGASSAIVDKEIRWIFKRTLIYSNTSIYWLATLLG